jgi:hypothetical protein
MTSTFSISLSSGKVLFHLAGDLEVDVDGGLQLETVGPNTRDTTSHVTLSHIALFTFLFLLGWLVEYFDKKGVTNGLGCVTVLFWVLLECCSSRPHNSLLGFLIGASDILACLA